MEDNELHQQLNKINIFTSIDQRQRVRFIGELQFQLDDERSWRKNTPDLMY